MVLYNACSPRGDIGPSPARETAYYFKSVCECAHHNAIRDRIHCKIALTEQTTRFLPNDVINLICQKVKLPFAPVDQLAIIDLAHETISFSNNLAQGKARLCLCIQEDLAVLRKHNPNIYVNGPIELVSLVLGAVGSGCVRASLLPILFENGTLAKFGVVQLRNSEYVFLTQETHPVFGCNIRPFLPLVVDDFDNLDAFVDIVFYKSCVLDSIGTNDMHRKT